MKASIPSEILQRIETDGSAAELTVQGAAVTRSLKAIEEPGLQAVIKSTRYPVTQ